MTDNGLGALAAALDQVIDGGFYYRDLYKTRPAEDAAAILAALPGWTLVRDEAGTRLVRVGYDLEQFGARTADGRLLTSQWSEPLDDGTYEPLFTATDDGMTLVATAEIAALRGALDGLVEVAEAYTTALDADLYRPGTPEDWWNREAALAALRAALTTKEAHG